jgi:hypothetical protein
MVSRLAIAAKAASGAARKSGVERSVYEKIYLGVAVGLGVVDSNPGANNGWLDGRQRIPESGKMYGQHEREAGSISSV